MPSQEVRHEIRFRQINQSSSMENLDCCPNHQHSFSLRLYICVCARRRARRGTWRWPLRRAWWSLGWPHRTSWRSCRQRAWRVYRRLHREGSLYESESLCPYGEDFGKLPPTWREAVADVSSREDSEQV